MDKPKWGDTRTLFWRSLGMKVAYGYIRIAHEVIEEYTLPESWVELQEKLRLRGRKLKRTSRRNEEERERDRTRRVSVAKRAEGSRRIYEWPASADDALMEDQKIIVNVAKANGYELLEYFVEDDPFTYLQKDWHSLDDQHEKVYEGETHEGFFEMVADILHENKDNRDPIVVFVYGLEHLSSDPKIQQMLIVYLASKGITLLNITDFPEEREYDEINKKWVDLGDPYKRATVVNVTEQVDPQLIEIQNLLLDCEKNIETHRRVEKARRKIEKTAGAKSTEEKKHDLVAQIRRLRTKRRGVCKSWQEIADILNKAGLRTARGKHFTAQNVALIHERSKVKNSGRKGIKIH